MQLQVSRYARGLSLHTPLDLLKCYTFLCKLRDHLNATAPELNDVDWEEPVLVETAEGTRSWRVDCQDDLTVPEGTQPGGGEAW